jgi:anti-sigma factor RsiW
MNCEQACELIALAASGDVTVAEQAAIENHKATCAGCREEAAAFAELSRELAAMRGEFLPESAFSAVRARVAEEIAAPRRPGWLAAWPAFAAVVACTAILAVLLRPVTRPVSEPVIESAVPPVVASASTPAVEPALPIAPIHRTRRPATHALHKPSDPLVIQMLTNDPDVIIYWIADARDNRAGKESNP